jgi:hypothetical protein
VTYLDCAIQLNSCHQLFKLLSPRAHTIIGYAQRPYTERVAPVQFPCWAISVFVNKHDSTWGFSLRVAVPSLLSMGGPSPFPSDGSGRGRGAPVSGRGAPAAPTPRQPTRMAPQIGDFMAGMPVCRMVKPPARDINRKAPCAFESPRLDSKPSFGSKM